MKFRAVVFDFDLTLADSTPAVVECSNYALVAMGFPTASVELVRHTIGLTLPHTFRALTGTNDPNLETDFARRFIARANDVMVTGTRIYPGVAQTLAALRNFGVRLGIVSTKYRYRIEAILARHGLTGSVDVIVGGEDVSEHKPHPEGLINALGRLAVQPSQTVYTGDHPIDAELARRAGTAFVAVRTGVSSLDVWTAWTPLAVIDNIGALESLLVSDQITR